MHGSGGTVSASIRRRWTRVWERPTRAAPHRRSDGAPAPVLRRHGPRVPRAGYNRKCLQALLAELEAAVAAAGRLAGGAADREIFAELAGLGRLLAPYPTLAHACAG